MKRPVIVALVVAVLLAAGIGGYLYWQQRQEAASTQIEVSGTVDADEVQITTLVGGRVVSAKISEGTQVRKGQEIYRIDDAALKLQLAQAASGVTAAKAALQQAKDDDLSNAEIAAARARLEQAQAAQKLAKVQLGYVRITSPADGVVTAVSTTLGETASTGRTMATILKADSVFVRAFVPEPRIGELRVGGSATITTDNGTSIDGTISFISAQAEFTPSNVETKDQRAKLVYEVRVRPKATSGLTVGMPVTVTFAE